MWRFVPGAGGEEPECDIQEKINFEIRMREGICKLLAVSTQKDQLLQAVKNLMVCNARILAYRTELQNKKEEPISSRTEEQSSENRSKDRVACRAKVAITANSVCCISFPLYADLHWICNRSCPACLEGTRACAYACRVENAVVNTSSMNREMS